MSLLGDPSSSLQEGPVRCAFGSWDDRWYYWPVLGCSSDGKLVLWDVLVWKLLKAVHLV